MVGTTTSVLVEAVNVSKEELEIIVRNARDDSIVPHASIGLTSMLSRKFCLFFAFV
jgi:hypothetical protein